MSAEMRIVIAAIAALGACATASPSATELHGRALAETHCGSCHAIGLSDESPAPEAPPLRSLSESYRVANLEEALAEGISVGHPAMPAFEFSPEDVDALITYLQAIQTQKPIVQEEQLLIDDGREIASAQCARCHAVGETGASPMREAPVLRAVLQRYRPEVLEEELIAGIRVTHPMPGFQFNPQGVGALIAYLQAIQEPPAAL